MEYFRQIMGSDKLSDVFDLPPALRDKKVEVIILPVEEGKHKEPSYKCRLGFVDVPPLPDSFFEPLTEEELEEWGL